MSDFQRRCLFSHLAIDAAFLIPNAHQFFNIILNPFGVAFAPAPFNW